MTGDWDKIIGGIEWIGGWGLVNGIGSFSGAKTVEEVIFFDEA